MSADYFFASYARADTDRALVKFVRTLRAELRGASGLNLQPDELDRIGFFDVTNIETGDEWLKTLGDAVRTCKVCVCLCSNTYFNRPYCGKEYHVFQKRRAKWLEQAGNENRPARVIIPVLWSPVDEPPPAVKIFQGDQNIYPKNYAQYGLKSLAETKSQNDAFKKVVAQLAKLIWSAVRDVQLPSMDALPPFDQIPSEFHQPTPYGVVLAAFHPHGVEWKPFGGESSMYYEVEAIASQLRTRIRTVAGDAKLADDIEKANHCREAVLVVTDPDTIRSADAATTLQKIHALGLRNFAILVVWDGPQGQPNTTLDAVRAAVAAACPWAASPESPNDLVRITTVQRLRSRTSETIDALRRSLKASDPALRATDATLEREAHAEGVPIAHAAVLSAHASPRP